MTTVTMIATIAGLIVAVVTLVGFLTRGAKRFVLVAVSDLTTSVVSLKELAQHNMEERGQVIASVEEVRDLAEGVARQLRPDGNGGHNFHGAVARIEIKADLIAVKADRASDNAERAVTAASIAAGDARVAAIDARAARELMATSISESKVVTSAISRDVDALRIQIVEAGDVAIMQQGVMQTAITDSADVLRGEMAAGRAEISHVGPNLADKESHHDE